MKKLFLLLSLSLGSAWGNNEENIREEYQKKLNEAFEKKEMPAVLESYKDFYLLSLGEQNRFSYELLKNNYLFFGDGRNRKINKIKLAETYVRTTCNDAEAQLQQAYFNYAESYYGNNDTSYDYAVEWLSLSAEQGHPLAENRLGEMYALGLGVEKDLEKAKYWFRRASNHGSKWAGLMLYNILIGKTNFDKKNTYLGTMKIDNFDIDKLFEMNKNNMEEACSLAMNYYLNRSLPQCTKIGIFPDKNKKIEKGSFDTKKIKYKKCSSFKEIEEIKEEAINKEIKEKKKNKAPPKTEEWDEKRWNEEWNKMHGWRNP